MFGHQTLRVATLLIASLLGWCSATWAASLEGQTTLGDDAVSGALVRARGIDRPSVFITRTAANGRYLLKGLDPGPYLLEVEVEGQLAFRERIEVRDPTTMRDIGLVTADSAPYVSIQIVGAVDDAVVILNKVQILRWGRDRSEMRKFALTQPSRNTLEVFVTPPASAGWSWPFSRASSVVWRYHLVVQASDGKGQPYEGAQPTPAGWPSRKSVRVFEATLVVDDTGKVTLQSVDREAWKKATADDRSPPVQF